MNVTRSRAFARPMALLLALLTAGCWDSGGSAGPEVVTLATLEIGGLALAPGFDPDEPDYQATVPYLTASIVVTAVPTDPAATVTIDGAVVQPRGEVSRTLDPGNNAVEIEVTNGDDRMVYTVTIDRAELRATAAITATPQLRDHGVGTSFDADGDLLLAGTPFDRGNARGINHVPVDQSLRASGAAFVFAKDSAGSWVQEAYVKASNAEIDDAFGYSVAMAGNVAVVGAPGEDSAVTGINGDETSNGAPGSGAAYVFLRDTSGVWNQEAYLKPTDTLAGAGFGYSVAFDGETIAVSAWRMDVGVIYLFNRDANGAWVQEASVVPADLAADVGFADAIDIDGDTLAVGAKWHGNPSTGAVYVFSRTAPGTWVQDVLLVAENGGANDSFGENVAVDGDTLVVGATNEASSATGIDGDGSDNSAPESGAAYVFTRADDGSWSQSAYLKSSNSESPDLFGSAVAVQGEWIAVGAENESSAAAGVDGDQEDDSLPGSGAIYLFRRDSSGEWNQELYAKAAIPHGNVRLGRGLAFTATGLAAAAPFEGGINGSPLRCGAMHVFE